ncbi:phage minor head protein, partial [Helcococcus ovis]|uniref:phage minor head protein n=1 Tax=Helcococcus ovis TaxID=72026 RepID=UPI0038BBF5CA
ILTSYVVNTAELDDSKRRGILAKKFEATLDKRTSKICREHGQRIIPIDKIKIGVNAPPLHPYCRSHLSDMLEGLDYDSEDELMRMIEGKNNHISRGHGDKIYPINDNVVNNLNGPNVDNLNQAENDAL